MKDILILADTRQQKDKHIANYFDKNDILWQRATLETGDYMAIKIEDGSLYKDFSTIIDTKKDVLEIAGNLCRTTEHERIKLEIMKAKLKNNENFIFLIADSKIENIDDLVGWSSPHTQVKGEVLAKIMKTMQERYGCKFVFCKKNQMGAKIIELLSQR